MATLIDKYSIEKMIDRYQKELDQLFAEQESLKVKSVPILKAPGGIEVPEDYRLRQGNPLVDEAAFFGNAVNTTPSWEFVDYGITPTKKFTNADGSGRQPMDWSNFGSNLASLSPVLYNLGQGLRRSEQLKAKDYYNPRRNSITSLMHNRRVNVQPQIDSVLEAQRIANYNASNAGGSRGNIQGNLSAIANNAMRNRAMILANKQNADLGYMGQEAEMLYNLGQGEAATNFSIKDYNLANIASRRNFLGTGFGQLSQYSQNKQLMANQAERDRQLLQIYPDMFKSVLGFMPGVQSIIDTVKLG